MKSRGGGSDRASATCVTTRTRCIDRLGAPVETSLAGHCAGLASSNLARSIDDAGSL